MSKLKNKVRFARDRGITIHKTVDILNRNRLEMERVSKTRNYSGGFPKVVVLRNLTGSGRFTLCVAESLINPLAGLTYREAANMAYEIAVNPSKIFKE